MFRPVHSSLIEILLLYQSEYYRYRAYHNVKVCSDHQTETLCDKHHQQTGDEEHSEPGAIERLRCHIIDYGREEEAAENL